MIRTASTCCQPPLILVVCRLVEKKGLLDLLDGPDLRVRLAAAGRETIVERFDIAKNVGRLAQLFYARGPKE